MSSCGSRSPSRSSTVVQLEPSLSSPERLKFDSSLIHFPLVLVNYHFTIVEVHPSVSAVLEHAQVNTFRHSRALSWIKQVPPGQYVLTDQSIILQLPEVGYLAAHGIDVVYS